MSVLVSKRNESRYEAIVSAERLHDLLRDLMHRHFGIKDLDHYVQVLYAYGDIESEDFQWFHSQMRRYKNILEDLSLQLTANLYGAEAIYPATLQEYEMRRDYLDRALATCNQIETVLMRVIGDFKQVDINAYGPVIKLIDRETDLIKKWRQRDNKFKSRLSG